MEIDGRIVDTTDRFTFPANYAVGKMSKIGYNVGCSQLNFMLFDYCVSLYMSHNNIKRIVLIILMMYSMNDLAGVVFTLYASFYCIFLYFYI